MDEREPKIFGEESARGSSKELDCAQFTGVFLFDLMDGKGILQVEQNCSLVPKYSIAVTMRARSLDPLVKTRVFGMTHPAAIQSWKIRAVEAGTAEDGCPHMIFSNYAQRFSPRLRRGHRSHPQMRSPWVSFSSRLPAMNVMPAIGPYIRHA